MTTKRRNKMLDFIEKVDKIKPMDISKMFVEEIVQYYSEIFDDYPSEYFVHNFGRKSNCPESKYLLKTPDEKKTYGSFNYSTSKKKIEKKFKVLNKFTFKSAVLTEKLDDEGITYVLNGGILLHLNDYSQSIVIFCKHGDQVQKIFDCIDFEEVKEQEKKLYFYLLTASSGGFHDRAMEFNNTKVDIKANYNDDLPYDKIRNFIETENNSGICLLYGVPGSGKTFFIRHLITECKDRKFIYMNKECLAAINQSSFVDYLLDNKNAIIIMEDCENVLVDRTEYNNTISTLLNLSDGLIGDNLNIKFICTFNTDICKIDTALLRKGRMKVCYEFKELSVEKANALAKKLGLDKEYDKPTALCEIMNEKEENGAENVNAPKTSRIGF